MLLELRMPRMGDVMTAGVVQRLADEGTRVERGTPLVEVLVDLATTADQNCRPVFRFRVVAHEAAWLRSVAVAEGADASVDQVIAVLSTERDEPLDGAAKRPLRVNVGVVPWS